MTMMKLKNMLKLNIFLNNQVVTLKIMMKNQELTLKWLKIRMKKQVLILNCLKIRMHNQVLIMKCLNTRIQKQVLILDFLKISMHKQGITLNCQLQDPDIMETHLIHQSILWKLIYMSKILIKIIRIHWGPSMRKLVHIILEGLNYFLNCFLINAIIIETSYKKFHLKSIKILNHRLIIKFLRAGGYDPLVKNGSEYKNGEGY